MSDLAVLQKRIGRASVLLRAMSNERRLFILCQLGEGEKSAGELKRLVGLSQSALSQHLAILRRDGLVETRRVAQTIFYSLASDEAAAILDTLCHMYGGEGIGKTVLVKRPAAR